MKKYVILYLFIVFAHLMHANNIAVSNIILTGQNTTAGANNVANFSLVQFSLSWDNSWRISTGASNWDAAWVFVKFRVGASDPTFTGVSSSGTTITVSSTTNLRVGMPVRVTGGTGAFAANTVISSITSSTQFEVSATPSTPLSSASVECLRIWEHARLNNTGHTAASGSTIDAGLLTPGSAFNTTTNPAVGVFIYRSSGGSGTNTFNNTQLRWNYGANGIADNAIVSIQVFAIEMVYVPGGVDFNVGGGGGTSAFTSTTINTATANAAGGFPTGQTAPANASWPNGYNAFYCMKYEISQGQYRDFLNTLTYQQQVNRTVVAPTSAAGTGALTSTNANRNGIDIQTPGNATTGVPAVYGCNLNGNTTYNEAADGEWIACNLLSWMDGCAYMQWSGLRPMTELEYEKACRGNQAAVSGEYAWGNATVTGATGISNDGANNETFSNSGANAAFNNAGGVQCPLRVGAFAGAATTREQSGATFYGIMEMSGNLWERPVTIGDATGRGYTGVHGSGTLSTAGHATASAWPGLTSGEVTEATGSGFRGGAWSNAATEMRVSDRVIAAAALLGRNNNVGFRGVRSAPLWTPANTTTALWLDAADASSITLNGSNVSQWNDKSGNARHATQGTVANQPVYSATAFPGSLPGLLFDGSNDIMDVSITTPIQNQTHGTYWVFSRSGAGSGDDYRPFIGIRAAGGISTDQGALHYVKTNDLGSSWPYVYAPAPGSQNYDNTGPSYVSNTGYVMSFQSNVTGWGVWRNGTLEGTTNGISTPNANNIGYSIGGQYAPLRRTNGVIAEVITFNVTDVATRQRIEGYLAHKWGLAGSLPANHPFKNSAPTR